jgi:ATP-dependent RNA helicase RhlE
MLENYSDEQSFQGLGIDQSILKRLTALNFVKPTPIQFKAIPVATTGEDVVGIAQTGSGKTLAFSIPMVQKVMNSDKIGLILLPTRELAIQVEETVKKVGSAFGVKTAVLIGGTSQGPQIRQLQAKPKIIVATPGRLIDHVEQRRLSLSKVGLLVLDEADRMLDMGFAPQLKRILSFIPNERQTMLFSATMPDEIAAIAQKYMKKPLRIEVAKPGTTVDTIEQEVFIVPREEKVALLGRLLSEHKGTILVFTRTKHGAKKVAHKIRNMGHTADELHSNRSQNQRQRALKGFSTGAYRIMVATDIAARGIDVDNIELVVNFDLPTQIQDYTHRIGRTGRAGRSGKAISFACPEQKGEVGQIQKLINLILPIKAPCGTNLESIRKDEPVIKKSGGGGRNRNSSGRRGNSRQGGRSRGRR